MTWKGKKKQTKREKEASKKRRRKKDRKNTTEAVKEARRDRYSRDTTEADREKLNQRWLRNYHKNKTDDSISRRRNEASCKAAARHAYIEEHRATFDRCKVGDTLCHEPPKMGVCIPATPQAGVTEFRGQPQNKEWYTINAHQNAETAALLCHHQSCIHQWPEDMDLTDEYTYNNIREKIRGQNVTPDIQAELASRFLKSQGRGSQEGGYLADNFRDAADDGRSPSGVSRDAPLCSCSVCGLRGFDTAINDEPRSFTYMNLNELAILELTDEQEHVHRQRIEKHSNVELPVMEMDLSSEGNSEMQHKPFDLWKAWSVFPQTKQPYIHTGKWYHLHPEFVEQANASENPIAQRGEGEYKPTTADGDSLPHKALVCEECRNSIRKKTLPDLSVAKGVDYGSFKRIGGLQELSFIERTILSKCRLYTQVVKIESNTGRQRGKLVILT